MGCSETRMSFSGLLHCCNTMPSSCQIHFWCVMKWHQIKLQRCNVCFAVLATGMSRLSSAWSSVCVCTSVIEIEPFFLHSYPCESRPVQCVEGALAGQTAVTLQATDLAKPVQGGALAALAATHLCRTWRLDDSCHQLLLVKKFSELTALA